MLHVFKYSSNELEKLIESINKMNYGLTLGVHSRIDNTINYIFKNANIGNIYVNRNITGAVVGVQPFGGRVYQEQVKSRWSELFDEFTK